MREYIRDVGSIPMMSEEENRRLIALAQTGDLEARNAIILGNWRFVVAIAKRYNKRAPMDDLVAEGNLGLFTAIRKFDLSKDVKFGTYAYWWIRNHITKMLAEPPYRGIIHVPGSMWNKIMRGEEHTLRGADRVVLRTAIASLMSVDGEWDCPDKRSEDPLETVCKQDQKRFVAELIRRANISERQKQILSMYVVDGATLQDISDVLNISKQRVREIKTNALDKLRKLNKLVN